MMTELEKWRIEHGLSYRALGTAIGTTGQYAENICKRGIPGMTRLAMIMIVTGGKVDWIDMLTDTGRDEMIRVGMLPGAEGEEFII